MTMSRTSKGFFSAARVTFNDDPRVCLETFLRLDQVDEFLGEIDIGHLNRAPFDRTGAPRPRRAYLRDTRIRRFGEASLSDLRKTTRVSKHGERHLYDRKVSPVAVNPRNDAVSADTPIVQFAHGVSVLKISLRRGRRTELRDAVNRFFLDAQNFLDALLEKVERDHVQTKIGRAHV